MLQEDAALALERAHSARVIESLAKRAREIDTAKQEMVVLRREANKSRELEAHRLGRRAGLFRDGSFQLILG